MNTFLAPCASALTFVLFEQTNFSVNNGFTVRDPSRIMNSILAGLVAITASCNNVTERSAIGIGAIGCLVYLGSCKFMKRFRFDDPIEASQIHGFTGFWGCLAVGIFDLENGMIYTGSLEQLWIQLIGALSCAAWTTGFCYCFFSILKSINRFRVSSFYEIIGIDLLMHASIHDLSIQKFFADRQQKLKNKDTHK